MKQANLHAQIEGWMSKFDINGDRLLQRPELAALLEYLHPERAPDEATLDFLIEKATAIESFSMRIAGNKNGAVSWHELRPTVARYHDYCKDQQYLDAVFRRFDVDASGTLDEAELPALLRAVAPSGCPVEDADVQYVFEKCDANGDGLISREEVLPMLASWTRLAVQRVGSDERLASWFELQKEWMMHSRIAVTTWRKASAVVGLRQAREGGGESQGATLAALVRAAEADASVTAENSENTVVAESSDRSLTRSPTRPISRQKTGAALKKQASQPQLRKESSAYLTLSPSADADADSLVASPLESPRRAGTVRLGRDVSNGHVAWAEGKSAKSSSMCVVL